MPKKSYTEEYQDCLDYIDSYWDTVTYQPTRKEIKHSVIDIPYPYITPNHKKFNFIFYWDTFFMFRGIMGTKRKWLMKEMINNFAFLFEKYGLIPNFNAPAAIGRTQPPFFTSMILDTYYSMVPYHDHKTVLRGKLHELRHNPEKRWLKKMISLAKREYLLVWIDEDNAFNHHVKDQLLSRYGDRDIGYAHSSELESGWDFTSRFYNRCNEFLPVDLNSLLYKYEIDFSSSAQLLGNEEDERFWTIRSDERKNEINKYMWNEDKGFFFDFDYKNNEQSDFYSLAGFFPLWAGIASADQAKKIVKHLGKFEGEFGLAATDKESLPEQMNLTKLSKKYQSAVTTLLKPKQWDYPHIWAPLEYITVIGLIRYGYIQEATRLMEKSVKANASLFRKYGTMLEKIDGSTGDKAGFFNYELQPGFGWTNGVFYRFIQILDELQSKNIIKEGAGETPPYTLTIAH